MLTNPPNDVQIKISQMKAIIDNLTFPHMEGNLRLVVKMRWPKEDQKSVHTTLSELVA